MLAGELSAVEQSLIQRIGFLQESPNLAQRHALNTSRW